MSCALFFCLSSLYVELGAGYVIPTPAPPPSAVAIYGPGVVWKYDANHAANPMGRLAIGHEWEPSSRVRVSFELRHESWIATTADHGQNSAWVSVRMRPFRAN
jgi:hypothetical protein